MLRRVSLRKGAAMLVLVAISAGLFWYGVWMNRIAARDFEFQLGGLSGNLIPEVLFLKGNYEYFVDLDFDTAGGYFRKAIGTNVLLTDAWFALAKLEVVEGNTEQAWKISDTLLPLISQVSTWKWQELLLAFDLRDEGRFAGALNFILSRLPNRRNEAFLLARAFWGNWAGMLPHISRENSPLSLVELIKFKEMDLAYDLWTTTKENGGAFDNDMQIFLCQFLLENGHIKEAKNVWKAVFGENTSGIYDGDFENEPLNTAFGWRFRKNPVVEVEQTDESCPSGKHCLHLHFNGTQNVSFIHVSQVVPVEPGKTLHLRFERGSSGITSDKGVLLDVSGYGCTGVRAESTPVSGTTPWAAEELEIPVPDSCEAVTVRVCRRESLMFDSKISGDYWLGGLELN